MQKEEKNPAASSLCHLLFARP